MGQVVHKILTWLWWLLLAAYLVALGIFLIGNFGLFGNPRDPLTGVYLIVLGFPWFFAADLLPDALKPWAAAAAPVVNILIVRWLARRTARNG